jgi:LacI family transcriptional regulator
MLLTNSEGHPGQDASRIELLEQRSVDGLLLLPTDESNPGTVAALRAVDCPVVLLDREVPEGEEIARVSFDHRSGMAAATRSLLELGHRRIAILYGGPRRPRRERRAGVEEAIAPVPGATLAVFEGELTVAAGEAIAAGLLSASPRPTAVIAAGNVFCEGMLLASSRLGVRIPDDMSLIGCDESPAAALHEPPISVVRRDMSAFGLRAAEALLSQLEGSPPTREFVLPTEFLERGSCARVDPVADRRRRIF